MGIKLHNKVPNPVKELDKYKLLDGFEVLSVSAYIFSVEECMSC
jgi:hypothetical protein